MTPDSCVVYVSDVAIVTDTCYYRSTCRTSGILVHVAPRFAPNGAENTMRGATRGRAANSGSAMLSEKRLSIITLRGAMRFIARGTV